MTGATRLAVWWRSVRRSPAVDWIDLLLARAAPGLRPRSACSAAVTNPYYRKRFPKRDEWHLQTVEALCFVWLVAIVALVWHGTIRLQHLPLAYLLLAWALGLNAVRNLAAHRYGNPGRK